VGPMPLGLDEDDVYGFSGEAVWVVYAGGAPKENTMMGAHVQPDTWAWAVYALSKRYRSSQERKQGALALMEQVLDVLVGVMILDAPLTKGRDQVAPVAPGKGVFGYEIIFTLEQELRRIP
ncbi:MAG: hypothetical protein GXY42_12595, partial [Desulfovibrionales bacterium]|nr:hypothetical protein [Desulfovibrionales bacterium]